MSEPTGRFSPAWREFRATTDLDEYETRWDRRAAAGHAVHGEVDFVMRFAPARVLDAGCGMGRVAIELDRRGVAAVGVDLDDDLLARARRRAPHLRFVRADLSEVHLAERFDVVVMAGNVLPFVEPGRCSAVVQRLAAHLRPGAVLVNGASLRAGWPALAAYDQWCAAAELELVERHGGWDGEPFDEDAPSYAVSVHRRPLD